MLRAVWKQSGRATSRVGARVLATAALRVRSAVVRAVPQFVTQQTAAMTSVARSAASANVASAPSATTTAAAGATDPLALRNPLNAKADAAVRALVSSASASASASASDRAQWDVVLYQYQTCPFCNKVRAFLDAYDIPYRVVEVNPLSKVELKWSAPSYQRVPVVTVRGERVVDSSDIISALYKLLPVDANAAPGTVARRTDGVSDDVTRWREWTDTHLMHLFPPNIYQSLGESFQSFDYMTDASAMTWPQRLAAKTVGGLAMYAVGKRNVKKYGIRSPRDDLFAAVNQWLSAFPGTRFHGGAAPDLADVTVFGALRSLAGFRVGAELAAAAAAAPGAKVSPQYTAWYNAMANAVGPSRRTNPLSRPTRFGESH